VIFGVTPALAAIRESILKVAPTDLPVLITGESGTGKEAIAYLIHHCSRVANKVFVQVNAAAIPQTLFESELFGHERGAFTGALHKPGRVELANSGTLFLDEIGELDLFVQAKLLHFMQDGQFTRIGGQEDRKGNARLILATNRNLREEVAAGSFREDLYYRINVVDIHMPPLRERLEDIPVITGYLLREYCDKHNFKRPPLSPSTIQRFQEYHWPGNIRQLENLIKRYVVLGAEHSILAELVEHESDVFKFSIPPGERVSLKQITRQAMRQVEKRVILQVVEANAWNRKRAAKLLNISYRALLSKLKEIGVPSERRRQISKSVPTPVQAGDPRK
jgi:two-component system response regulator AtoC